MQANVRLLLDAPYYLHTVTHVYLTSAIRPHGSTRPSDPGIHELSDRGGEPAHQLHCGGRAGCSHGVHMGIPRTTGQTLICFHGSIQHSIHSVGLTYDFNNVNKSLFNVLQTTKKLFRCM